MRIAAALLVAVIVPCAFGLSVEIPDPAPAKDAKVTASDWEQKAKGGWADFPPEKTLDGDLEKNSSWRAESHEGKGQWIQYDLGVEKLVSAVRIAFMAGDTRKYRFKLESSTDGKTWVCHVDGESSGNRVDFERYELENVKARYVRITGFGNTNPKFPAWINLTEVEVLVQ